MQTPEYLQLCQKFLAPTKENRPDLYLETALLADDAALDARLVTLAQAGIGSVIPLLTESRQEDGRAELGLRQMGMYARRYAALIEKICRVDLNVSFVFEPAYERHYLASIDSEFDESASAKELLPIEYVCGEGEEVRLFLRGDSLMSLVAFEESAAQVIDLREFVTDRLLTWQVPAGNWKVIQFVCTDCVDEDGNAHRVNSLNYDAALEYLRQTYDIFSNLLEPIRGERFCAIGYRDLAFDAPNHRNWDPDFNRVFIRRYGVDPALLYPSLFYDLGPRTERDKALLLDCRAHMLAEGMLRAYADFAAELGVALRGSLCEPKLPACSLLNGDALLGGKFTAGAMLEKAYLYGANSVKLAAGAAYNYGHCAVNCEIYRDYPPYTPEIYYSEACNAFSHGANHMLIHHVKTAWKDGVPDFSQRGDFYQFAARTQALLCGGEHIADIAMLYPIYSLHAQVYFYRAEVQGFEYPDTPVNADYMSLINSISIYAGHDLTLLHPETLNTRCRVEDGVLYLDNGKTKEAFRVLILPSTQMISIGNLRLLAAFFAAGGKIIATGELPRCAFERDHDGSNDREVERLVREIFGQDIFDGDILRSYDYHTNDAGGEAYHLSAELTAIDGTDMVPGALIDETIKSLNLPYDVLMPGMIHLECTGALSLPYPDFVRLGLDRFIPGKGMLSHIHKRKDECDIYYFANTTDRIYDREILLRGAHCLEVWDPHTGEIRPLAVNYVTYRDTVYTQTRLKLESGRSIFYISPAAEAPKVISALESIEELQ
ncbi:MAG: hypothetical protein IJF49_01450 [Clostridia bacterium]|nr:hypothetical protein [Clostridia bacterium]